MTLNVPSNIEAEESYIGALLLSPHKLLDSMNMIAPEDFYRPLYGQVFAVVRELVSRGEQTDYVTVQNELRTRGTDVELDVLSSLQMNTPGTHGATRWAQIILEKSDARRTLHVLGDATSEIYEGADPYETAADISKELALLGTPADRESESTTLAYLESLGDTASPVVIPGLLRQDWRTIIVGAEGASKALDVDTPLLTTDGWKTMGSVSVGDYVFSSNGHPVRVIEATEPFMGNCYRMEFNDGVSMIADAGHLWLTETLYSRERSATERRKIANGIKRADWRNQLWKRVHFPEVVTTQHISETLMARNGHAVNHSIEVCLPLNFPAKDLPLDPYVLGVWLGDGTSKLPQITSMDKEIINHVVEAGFPIMHVDTKPDNRASTYGFGKALTEPLRFLNVIGSSYKRLDTGRKHIPEIYKTASYEQRLALLQGLMDTDGSVTPLGKENGRGFGSSRCTFSITNQELAEDTLELILGLGIKATITKGVAKIYGREISDVYDIGFQTDLPIFRLTRKLERLTPLRTRRSKLRYIKKCDPVAPRMVRCIQVENEDGMFVVGRELIPTHNSTVIRSIAITASQGHHPFWFSNKMPPVRVLLVDLENPVEAILETGSKLMSYIKAIDAGTYDEERLKIWRRPGGINLRAQRDRADLQREIINHQPDLVCIGPLYKMYSRNSSESYEESAEDVMKILDDLRTKYNFALLMEHHAPKPSAGQKRDMTPFGSSLWLRWPEVGISLYADKTDPRVINVRRFRGDRLSNVEWPDSIVRDSNTIISGKWDDRAPDSITRSTR